jgi:hypothetical protein
VWNPRTKHCKSSIRAFDYILALSTLEGFDISTGTLRLGFNSLTQTTESYPYQHAILVCLATNLNLSVFTWLIQFRQRQADIWNDSPILLIRYKSNQNSTNQITSLLIGAILSRLHENRPMGWDLKFTAYGVSTVPSDVGI